MSGESQDLGNKIAGAGILEGEWPLCIVAGEHHSIAARFVRVGLAFLALPTVLILVGWREGNLVLPGAAIGLLEDWNILAMFGAFPAAVLLLVLAARRFDEFVKRLARMVDEDGARQRGETVVEIQSLYADIAAGTGLWRTLRMVLVGAGVLFVAFNAFNRYFRFSALYSTSFWTSSEYPLSFWTTNLYTVMVWGYVGPVVAFKLISLLFIIARIVGTIGNKFKFRPIVLSADRSGGLKTLGNLALALSYVVLPFQINCLAYYYWIPKVNVPFVIGFSTVLAATLVLFSVPVWLTHRAMTRVRDAVLERVSDAYNRRLQEILGGAEVVTPPRFERALAEMKGLDEVFSASLRIRVWPVDFGVLGPFGAVLVAPLLIAFLQQLLKLK